MLLPPPSQWACPEQRALEDKVGFGMAQAASAVAAVAAMAAEAAHAAASAAVAAAVVAPAVAALAAVAADRLSEPQMVAAALWLGVAADARQARPPGPAAVFARPLGAPVEPLTRNRSSIAPPCVAQMLSAPTALAVGHFAAKALAVRLVPAALWGVVAASVVAAASPMTVTVEPA